MDHQPVTKRSRCNGGSTEKKTSTTPSTTTTLDTLPPDVIHRIQLLLPVDEAYRTCVLSKTCLQAWSAAPYLVFCEPFENKIFPDKQQLRRAWIESIDRTFFRYSQDKLSLERVHLCITIDNVYLLSPVNRWLEIAAQRGTRHLRFESYYGFRDPGLPLSVHQADFGFGSGSWRCLQSLELRYVSIQEEELNDLSINDNCPFLERIMLHYCKGFEKIKVAKLDNLRELEVCTHEDAVFAIENAPRLCRFSYERTRKGFVDGRGVIAKPSWQNLKHLALHGAGVRIDVPFFDVLIPEYGGSLETLSIAHCITPRVFRVTSATLKEITLKFCDGVNEVDINAPKLNSFCYGGSVLPTLSFGNLIPVIEETGEAAFTWKYYF